MDEEGSMPWEQDIQKQRHEFAAGFNITSSVMLEGKARNSLQKDLNLKLWGLEFYYLVDPSFSNV